MTEHSWRGRILPIAVTGFSAATIALFFVSRGKWSDAMIDSGREWIVPDALARGDLLYRDVVYWFGPFTPYFHAAFFEVLGSSFRTLVIAGLVGSVGALAALYLALRSVTRPLDAALWSCLAVPVLVFMPNAGGPILGMGYRIWHAAAFSLAAIVAATGVPAARRPISRLILVGTLSALAGLCRTEWGIATLLAGMAAMLTRPQSLRHTVVNVAWTLAAFLVLFGGVLGAFCVMAGWNAVVNDCHVLLTGLPEETRVFLLKFSGVQDWPSGLAQMAYSTAMWVGVFLLIELWALRRDPHRLRRRVPGLATLLAVLALAALMGGAGGAVLFSAAPAICAAAAIAGLRAPAEPRSPALAAFGLLGVLVSYRRPFHISDSAYVGPPLLIAFICAAGFVSLAIGREHQPEVRGRLLNALPTVLVSLIVISFAFRAIGYFEDPRVPIPGTGGMLSARPEVVGEVVKITEALRREPPQEAGLVVFPEGEVLNYLSSRANPLRYKLYIPGYLTKDNERQILGGLSGAVPVAVAIWDRPIGEYGRSSFGGDYGTSISRWIENNCESLRVDPSRQSLRPRPRIRGKLCTSLTMVSQLRAGKSLLRKAALP